MNNSRIVERTERREGERERKYVKKVRNDVLGNLAILWVAAITVVLIVNLNPEDWTNTAKQVLSGFVTAGATSIFVYRVALNGATARFSAIEMNRITRDAVEIERAKMFVERASLMDGKVHERAFDIALNYPEVDEEHVQLFGTDEEYSTLPKCIKLQRLGEKFPDQVGNAMEQARRE